VLVDPGSGSLERIGRSGADLSTLQYILITRLHIDHTGDLPAVVAHLYSRHRRRPISLAGPAKRSPNGAAPENAWAQPGAAEFVRLLFGPDGAWRYTNIFEGFGVDVRETPSDPEDATIDAIPVDEVLEDLGVSIYAAAVPDGMMPAIAYRVECDERSVVFSGDGPGNAAAPMALARNCSMLVHDFARPAAAGRAARESGAQILLLSHCLPAVESDLAAALAVVRREYGGKIAFASDLDIHDFP
jgi:ribonuclease BN (tRNA processing enzyme)